MYYLAIYCSGSSSSEIDNQLYKIRHFLNNIFRDSSLWIELGLFQDVIPNETLHLSQKHELRQLLSEIENKKYNIVAVDNMDVFGNFATIGNFGKLISLFKDNDCKLLSVSEQDVLIGQASIDGLKMPSLKRRAPFGYKYKDNELIIDSKPIPSKNFPLAKRAPAEIIQWIFKKYTQFKSFSEISNQLNSQNVASPHSSYQNRKGTLFKSSKPWNRQQIKNILKNPIYKGEKPGIKLEPIISQELYNLVQSNLPNNN